MPRIRKKTSKRGTTRHRESIKHKISEHRKKTKKQARKDKATGKPVQKKSKKDPGIPNNFPYKDRILAEVEEQRRQAAAERQRRKEEKRAAAAGNGSNDLEKSPTPEDIAVDEKNGQGFDGIMSLRPVSIPQKKDNGNTVKERIPAIPVYPGPSTLRLVVQKADVVLHVVDARDPAAGMSEALVEAAQGKLMVLLNKADTVPRESLIQWLAHLRTSYTVLPFRVSSAFMPSATPFEAPNKKAKPMPKDDALGLAGLWTHLDTLAQMKNGEELVVAVTGVTNTGKSAVINSILGSDVFSIYNMHMAASAKGPSTTTSAQEVVATMPGNDARRVRFIDTPGLEFVRGASSTDQEREMMRARDILLRCRGRIDRLKDPLFAVMHIVARVDTQDLMLAYSLPAFLQGDVTGFLAGVARVNRLIKKGGVLDHAGAARIVLRDWRTGKLMRYSMPAGAPEGMMEGDAPVLGSVKSRKELRSAVEVKLVKMDAGESDTRDIGWDVSWEEEEEEEEEERSRDEDGDEEEEELPGRAAGSEDRPGKRRVSFAVETEKRRRRRVV
ncbi:P-loop containing nucleoside triphosphate hydrolase protein [Boletus edulis BED1]|uniref:P-loop containing nucleoside triphosphate hydrolase protein n=1 Tax=Boletus edulis BED1 TaxID=1328754 RepID=A0AAD4C7D3_BOLED|nr:P-loop containing nucleoside triphosphate hydrolase protein [Boletus edulis BED1]